ncbi:hypothetical protein [Clostridium sp. CCUG 7971]|uniref:hypothetical protein n=1 Tax=Clostridium sp. CCUG 7971 TaxID=2811414 RepID=UPI001ABBC251|nr:hypothetical protein [Clostridium sp. CCUG 7971]MBO3444164.1 hypothetical protein [Clostridium sp. CCUG 7971]
MVYSEKILNLILSNGEKIINRVVKWPKYIWLLISFLALCISINGLKYILENLN